MSASSLPRRPRKLGPRRTISIVGGLYNEELVNALINSTNDELVRLMPSISVPVYRVPGAFEIPVCVKHLLENSSTDVVVALGVIIRGQTGHADLVGEAVTKALQELAVEYGKPIIHEVLLVDSKEQAVERCTGEKNRGTEAARAAVTMAELFAKLKLSTAPSGPRKPVVTNG